MRRLNVVDSEHFPAYVVWELTLRCDHACSFCGSRAAVPRMGELSTEEALAVVPQLRAMRAKEVVLIGGEAYLHPGFLRIVEALDAAGITAVMTTGGFGIDAERAQAMSASGLQRVSVSFDGTEAAHDRLRSKRGSFAQALSALRHLRDAGIAISANTNVNRTNLDTLEALHEILVDAGVQSWQVQLTAPLGRAADRPEMLLQPYELLALMPRLEALKRQRRLLLMLGNNLGYFGPHEGALRSIEPDGRDHFRGCQAGKFVLGIESTGAVKGCPSLQASYVRGSVKTERLAEVWPKLDLKKERWGFCATCDFGEVCGGGCSFTSHAVFGRPGNNPYCHHRAHTLAQQGLREELVQKERAPGVPFDNGRFEIRLSAAPADLFEERSAQ